MSRFAVDRGSDTDFWLTGGAEELGGSWLGGDAAPAAPDGGQAMPIGDATGLGAWGASRRFPSAGPSAEDRGDGGGPALPKPKAEARNLPARVVGREVVAGGTRLTISAGWEHGVFAGMSGHLVDGGGRSVADFTVDDPRDTFSFALTAEHHQDTLKSALRAVVNPGGKT
jgi:hypothetical protein